MDNIIRLDIPGGRRGRAERVGRSIASGRAHFRRRRRLGSSLPIRCRPIWLRAAQARAALSGGKRGEPGVQLIILMIAINNTNNSIIIIPRVCVWRRPRFVSHWARSGNICAPALAPGCRGRPSALRSPELASQHRGPARSPARRSPRSRRANPALIWIITVVVAAAAAESNLFLSAGRLSADSLGGIVLSSPINTGPDGAG